MISCLEQKNSWERKLPQLNIGFDPSADSLHIGNLVGIMMLKHFQLKGHIPIALVGGATGMIGDPSGRSLERNLLDEKTLRHNQECIKKQYPDSWIFPEMLRIKRLW